MIISHSREFIFLKVSKTASSSMEVALFEYLEPNDANSPVKGAGSVCPNFQVRNKCGKHVSAEAVRKNLGEKIWDKYFKFCFVRNPWDRVVSCYYHRNPDCSLTEFVHSDLVSFNLKYRTGRRIYKIGKKFVADKIYRFEDLKEAAIDIEERLNLPKPLVLPHLKAKSRPPGIHYREVLSDKDRDTIAELYKEEIRKFGYTY